MNEDILILDMTREELKNLLQKKAKENAFWGFVAGSGFGGLFMMVLSYYWTVKWCW